MQICNVLMMITGGIETLAICHWYRFHWPWFSLQCLFDHTKPRIFHNAGLDKAYPL